MRAQAWNAERIALSRGVLFPLADSLFITAEVGFGPS